MTTDERHLRSGSSRDARRPLRAVPRRLWTRLSILAGIGLAAAVAVLTMGGAAQATVNPGTRLVAGYLDGLPLATRLGAAPASHTMTIGVELQRPDAAGELALYEEMYRRESPEFHHFLTPAQFNRRFGVRPAQSAAVRHWLTSGGLTIQTASGDYFTAHGTVAQLDRLLDVNIGRYTFKGKGFVANDAPPSVPDSLPVAGIAGLDTINRFTLNALHGHMLKRLAALGHAAAPHDPVAAARAVGPQAGNENEFTPQELWGIYNDPGAASLTKSDGTSSASALENSSVSLGQGQVMGIFGEGETSSVVAQLRLFETAMGFPKVPVRTVHDRRRARLGLRRQHGRDRVVPGLAVLHRHGAGRLSARLLLRQDPVRRRHLRGLQRRGRTTRAVRAR